jgi:chitin synthase
VSAVPLSLPGTYYLALNALRPFLHCVTPFNPAFPRFSAFAGVFSLTLTGDVNGATLSLSTSGIDTKAGLLDVPAEPGYRAFDVFYYLLESQSEQEREYLGLKPAHKYSLLKKSETYDTPAYLPTADDAAAAEDFRLSLKAIGIKGKSLRSLLAVLAAILRLGDALGFLVDQEELETTCDEVSELLDLEPEVLLQKCATEEREVFIAALYEAVVDWVLTQANEAIRHDIRTGRSMGSGTDSDAGAATPPSSHEDEDSVSITVIEIPAQNLGKATTLKTVFDDSVGINAEMKADGVPIAPAGSSVIRETQEAISVCGPDLGLSSGPLGRDHESALDRRQGLLEKIGAETDSESFLHRLLYPISGDGIVLGKHARVSLAAILASSRVWFQLCLHPSDEPPAQFANLAPQNSPWSAGCVSTQIRSWRLPEWANFRNKQLDFTADFDYDEFADRFRPLGCMDGRDGIEAWITERGWSNGEVVLGTERIWMREIAWWEAESMLDMKPAGDVSSGTLLGGPFATPAMESTYSLNTPAGMESGYFDESKDNLLADRASRMAPSRLGARSLAPTLANTVRSVSGGDYGLGRKGDDKRNFISYDGEVDGEFTDGKDVIVEKVSFGRRVWVAVVWALTFWIPSPLLKYVGRMKRPDVRMAWREKLVLVFLIALLNALVVFYIIEFGRLLCPNFDKAWSPTEVGFHTADNDYWVSFRGGVYDLSKFWRLQHSDTNIETNAQNMKPFAGTDVTGYIVPPLSIACPGYVPVDSSIKLTPNATLEYLSIANHDSGNMTLFRESALLNTDWYPNVFLPKMKEFYKGKLVYGTNVVHDQGTNDNRPWVIIDQKIYDLTDYFNTLKLMNNLPQYEFLPSDVVDLVQSNPGLDITEQWNEKLNRTTRLNSLNCFNNIFYIGDADFRYSARCQVQNYILLGFTIIICAVIGVKFLAALQLGSKRRPAQQDKFVICQVPAYTEGEDSLRKGLDSLTALAYDNKRKLICVICDGMIVGGGNDRPTPKIVLDILGVDPKTDPPALPFKSIGVGSEQLNYGKVYSGLYEYEGNVVPYVVVVKVGKETEQSKSKPGNRGKRDSQIMLMSFLNRVHHRAPMSPLELEMFHQINNIIGVDPELYEYLFMVDADTKVKEDSLNRLVAACANDATIAGICGETSLENEEGSWWTMIQVYEYYISHNLAKAFESLFGSVTCLPGWYVLDLPVLIEMLLTSLQFHHVPPAYR